MDINNLSNNSFTGIHLKKSKMSRVQKNISESIARAISYSDEYLDASERGVDVYLLPGKYQDSVKLRFMDTKSDFFIKDKDGKKYLQEEMYSVSNENVEKILKRLKDIVDGFIPRPLRNDEKILNRKTDLARVRPEVYDDVFQESRTLLDIMDEKDAKLYAWEHLSLSDSNF